MRITEITNNETVTEKKGFIHKRRGDSTLCKSAVKDPSKISNTWKNVTCKKCRGHWDSPDRNRRNIGSFNMGSYGG